jgi:hypothetical protein
VVRVWGGLGVWVRGAAEGSGMKRWTSVGASMGIKLSPDLPVNAIWYDTVYLPYWSYMTSGGG